MSRPAHARSARHRLPLRWTGTLAVSATLATVPALATPLAPNDIRTVAVTSVALAAQPALFDPQLNPVLSQLAGELYVSLQAADFTPEQLGVIDDFFEGGLAGVLKTQATSRLTHPDQVQIISDFFEGGVIQSEARRFLALFNDPQQQQFIRDFVTGGLIQVVRNRLLDSAGTQQQRDAIIAFFPDEVTDYRGGPITMLQRRLIAAAKGNGAVIDVVNHVFDNPVLSAARHLIGGGPLIGTPLHELPDAAPLHTEPAPAPTTRSAALVDVPAEPVETELEAASETESEADPEPEAEPEAQAVRPAEPEDAAQVDMNSGNKVEPGTVVGQRRARVGKDGLGIFGQVAGQVVTAINGALANSFPAAPNSATGNEHDAATTSDKTDAGNQGTER